MANRKTRSNIKDERIEDVTMYGEFISSFDQWQTLDRQRQVAEHLEEVTTKKDSQDDKTEKKRSR